MSQKATGRWQQRTTGGARPLPALCNNPRWGADVVLYVRSSSDDQQRSCPQQIAAVEAHAKSESWISREVKLPRRHSPDSGVFVDDGVSGWKFDPEQRAGSSALLRFCEENPRQDSALGLVVIWALSRLGRFRHGPEEAIYWIHRFRRAGWKVRSLTQPGLDSDDRDRLLAVIRTALESEKDTSSSEEKGAGVSRGKEDLIRLGVWHGGAAPFGYERWAAKVDEQKREVTEWVEELRGDKRNGNPGTHTVLRPGLHAKTLQSLFHVYVHGEDGQAISLEELARRFNEDGVKIRRRKSRQGKGWYHTTLSKLLRNEKYLALQRDRAGVAHAALWEPLVEPELWEAAQQRLGTNQRIGRGVNAAYALSGVLHCTICKRALHGDSTDGILYYKSKRLAPGARRCEACRRRVRADVIEQAVLEAIPQLADHPICLQRIHEERKALRHGTQRAQDRRSRLRERIRECETQIERLVDSLAVGGAAAVAIHGRMSTLNDEIARLEAENSRLAAGELGRSPAAEHAAEASVFTSAFEQASPAERKALVSHLVARIDVDIPRGRVVVGFRNPPLMAA